MSYEIDAEQLFLLEEFLSRVKTELNVQRLCREAWEDFLLAVNNGRGVWWLQLDEREEDTTLQRFMLHRFEDMLVEKKELQGKLGDLLMENRLLSSELQWVKEALDEERSLDVSRHEERLMRIGIAIRALRKARGLSQGDLAENANIRCSLLESIEKSEPSKNFSIDVLFNIADALGVKPADLLAFGDGKEGHNG